MNCPKCLENMATVSFHDILVDRCPRCGGLFFDVTELQRLLGMRGAESIDIAPAPINNELDQVSQIYCPRCLQRGMRVRMVTLVDADRPKIRFERCPDCGGSYLVAGEFHELKRNSLVNFLHNRLSKQSEQKGAIP